MAELDRLSNSDDRRSTDRTELGRRGVLRIGGDPRSTEVTVLDLTREGCRVETDVIVPDNADIEIGIGNLGRMKASVMWRKHDSFGCAFDVPLPPGAITAALGPTNVVALPSESTYAAPAPLTHKFSPRTRLFLLLGASIVCWAAIGAVVLAIA